jgi:hypothetical protein
MRFETADPTVSCNADDTFSCHHGNCCPRSELKSVVRYFILCRSIVHDAPQLWVVGDFMLLEGPTTYYVTTYALALFGVLILGVLWRLLSLTEMGNFFPMRLCVGRRQRWCCGFVEVRACIRTVTMVVVPSSV